MSDNTRVCRHMPLTVGAYAVGSDEHNEQVIIEFGQVGGGEAAGARVLGPASARASIRSSAGDLVVDAAIGADVILTGERVAHVVAELVRVVNREAARTAKVTQRSSR